MKKSILQKKSNEFALKIVSLYTIHFEDKKALPLVRQILKSVTSICINIEKSIDSHSYADSYLHISIAYMRTRETFHLIIRLWCLKLIDLNLSTELLRDCEELLKLLDMQNNILKRMNVSEHA